VVPVTNFAGSQNGQSPLNVELLLIDKTTRAISAKKTVSSVAGDVAKSVLVLSSGQGVVVYESGLKIIAQPFSSTAGQLSLGTVLTLWDKPSNASHADISLVEVGSNRVFASIGSTNGSARQLIGLEFNPQSREVTVAPFVIATTSTNNPEVFTWSQTDATFYDGSVYVTWTDFANNETDVYKLTGTVAPTIAITSNRSSVKAGETATISFTLSESSTDFSSSDVAVTGGTLSNFAGSGAIYSATFTPTTNSTANGVVSVASSRFSDAAGNFNNDGTEANNTVTMTVDTLVRTIQFASTTRSGNEGNSGTATITIDAVLSAASTQAVTVPITYSGTATLGTDYSNATTSITIAAGQTTGSASFSVIGDTTVESNETVILTLGTPTGGAGTTLTTSSGAVVSNLTSLPSGNSARTYNAWIQLEPGDSGTIIGHGTVDPTYFYRRSAFLVDPNRLLLEFQVGSVEAKNLSLADGKWHMVTAVFDPTSTANSNFGVSFYIDGSPVSNVTAGVNGFNKTAVNTINYQNTATFAGEYAVVNGATVGTINTSTGLAGSKIDDAGIWNRALTAAEVSGLFMNPASLPSGLTTIQYVADGYRTGVATLGTNTTFTHTIVNDDSPTLQFSTASGSANEGNSGTTTITIDAVLSAASTQTVTVPIAYSGSASSGIDYNNASTSITIFAGQTTGSASFSVLGDTTLESDETIVLTMGTATNATLGANTTFTHTIVNDDTTTYSITANQSSVNEGSTATFAVTTTNVASGTSLAYTLSGVSALDITGGSLSGTT
ncbi:MAG: hypothetical protein EB072_13595, partial [Betaproteobacteria bacterium]|nr:hypothetical protein [Betaproteobacteria bacterium]